MLQLKSTTRLSISPPTPAQLKIGKILSLFTLILAIFSYTSLAQKSVPKFFYSEQNRNSSFTPNNIFSVEKYAPFAATLVVDDNLSCPSASFSTIQAAVNAAGAGDTIQVCAGTYNEDVNLNVSGLSLIGAGSANTTIVGQIGGDGATIRVTANNVTVAGFTITRAGNNVTDWNNLGLNSAGVAVQGQSISGFLLRDNVISGNRSAIDINDSSNHTIRNNVITGNHTGLIFRNVTDYMTVTENEIRANRTVGILFLDASGGSNSPLQTSLHSGFSNNNISGNWYGQIVDRQSGGSLPTPGTTNLKNFRGNWFGKTNPVVTTANSAELPYASLIPVEFGGSATAPGGQPDIAGPGSANFKTSPLLISGTDTNAETTPGRGIFGFQGVSNAVRPNAANGWASVSQRTASGVFVNGPATPPAGFGSYKMATGAGNSGPDLPQTGAGQGGKSWITTQAYDGTLLADITDLKYSTYVTANPASAITAPTLQFQIDLDGNGTRDSAMIFEPYYSSIANGGTQPNVTTGTWQTWDARAGRWWFNQTTVFGAPQSAFPTFSAVVAAYPNAKIVTWFPLADGYGMQFVVGQNSAGAPWNDFDGNIDNLTVGINNASVNFDFEPTSVLVVDADGQASETDCNAATPAATTIGAAVAAANPGNTIRVCSGTYNLASTVNLNKAGLTILGVGATRPIVQIPTATGYGFAVGAANVTLDNLEIQKTDLGTPSVPHNMILVLGSNFTAQNNLIYGPNPGGTWNATNYVSRAFEVGGGLSGLLFQNNTIHTLRQPAYINTSSGSALNNNVSGTKGWVIDGGNIAFNANTFGEPQNQDCDIALLASVNPANYPNLLALSQNNDNGFICAQYAGGQNGRAIAYVDATPSAGNGSDNSNYTTITEGINGALPGGTVQVAEGTYVENLVINKSLTVLGPNATVNPNTGSRNPEAILMTPTSDPTYTTGIEQVIISAENVTFSGFTIDGDNPGLVSGVVFNGADVNSGYGITGTGTANPRSTITNNIIKNIGEFGIFLYGTNAGGAANSTIANNKLDNIPGQVFGQAIHIRDNAYANVTGNVVSRSGLGVVIENFSNSGAAAASISNNQISAHIFGIRHNLHYNYTTQPFTISNNTITSYVESFARTSPVTRFNGIRVESIQGTVPVNITNNTITPNRAALIGNGYTRVDGIYITNTSTVSPNISITNNTISNALRGISHTTPAVPNVSCNLITGNDTGVYVGTDLGFGNAPSTSTNGININQNNIVGNSAFGVQNDTTVVTNAENNYWGAANGPRPTGSGDLISANVDAVPFLAAVSGCSTAPPALVSISGTITNGSSPLQNVTVTLSGTQSGSMQTDVNGNFAFNNLPNNGNYLVTPTLAGYTFEPVNRNYTNLTTAVTNSNFVGSTAGSARLIRVVSQNVTPGANATVPIEMISQGNENSIGFSLNYNPSVIFNPTVVLGTDAAGGTLVVNNNTAGQLGIIVALPSGNTFGAGTRQIARVTFNTSLAPPFSTPVSFSDTPILRQVANANADVLPASYSSGNVTFAQGFESDVAPRPNGSGTGIITVADYTQTGRFAAALDTADSVTTNEFQRADAAPRGTKGDGLITVTDYTQAGRYAAGLDAVQTAGGPTVANLFEYATKFEKKQDVMKEQLLPRILRVVSQQASRGQQVVVPFVIDAEGDENGFGFTVSYDPAVLSNPSVQLGTDLPNGTFFANTFTVGKVGVIAAAPIGQAVPAGSRQIVTIRFDIAPNAPGGATPLLMVGHPPVVNEVSSVNADVLPTTFTGGFVNILIPTASNATVGGSVTDAYGNPIPRVRVLLTDTNGASRSAVTNNFGMFVIEDVPTGQTYVLNAAAKGFTFTPQVVDVTQNVSGLSLIGEQ